VAKYDYEAEHRKIEALIASSPDVDDIYEDDERSSRNTEFE
jgi:hypothetical protein